MNYAIAHVINHLLKFAIQFHVVRSVQRLISELQMVSLKSTKKDVRAELPFGCMNMVCAPGFFGVVIF